MATAKRPLDVVDEDGFQLVSRKRHPLRRDRSTTASQTSLSQWRIENHWKANAYCEVRWLQDELKIALRVDVSLTGDFLLRGADYGTITTLEEVAAGKPRGIVLRCLDRYRKGVIEGFPTALPLDGVK